MVATNFLWNPGTSNSGLTIAAASVLTTELNSLTTTSYAVSSVGGASGKFDNTNWGQAIWADVFVTLGAIGTALSVGANLSGWFLTSYDGTNYEQQSVAPPRAPDFIIPLPASTISAATIWKGSGLVLIPPLKFFVSLQNNTGQTLAGSAANTVRIAPVNMQAL